MADTPRMMEPCSCRNRWIPSAPRRSRLTGCGPFKAGHAARPNPNVQSTPNPWQAPAPSSPPPVTLRLGHSPRRGAGPWSLGHLLALPWAPRVQSAGQPSVGQILCAAGLLGRQVCRVAGRRMLVRRTAKPARTGACGVGCRPMRADGDANLSGVPFPCDLAERGGPPRELRCGRMQALMLRSMLVVRDGLSGTIESCLCANCLGSLRFL